jgi:hypothetical protein
MKIVYLYDREYKNHPMKTFRLFLLTAILLAHASTLLAGDVFAEYKMTGIGDKISTSRMYMKNGDLRTESIMKFGDNEMTSVTLNLKSNPAFTINFNSRSKTYTEVRKNNESTKANNLSVSVLGKEKIGAYACVHVRMTSDSSSWDMWVTKDLPAFNFPINNSNEAEDRKMRELLKSKSADGVPVKMAFLKPGTNTPTLTMELVKYENKTLDPSLFEIPKGYKKSNAQFDPEKMKSMSPEEKREMIKKMMEEYNPQK